MPFQNINFNNSYYFVVTAMEIKAAKTSLENILRLRKLFLLESNFQVRYNACHERGWTDSYLLTIDDLEIGYGSVKGQEIADRDSIFEFYVIPSFRNLSVNIFKKLITASGAGIIECQSNDRLLTYLLYEFAKNINADTILFDDAIATSHCSDDTAFRKAKQGDKIFEHKAEPAGDYVLEQKSEVVATGGFLLHYNFPFADLYMEVKEDCRRKGLGSFILQEVKKECYLAGRVPAARCDINNTASKACLLKAGFKVCGYMLKGEIKNPRK
jgi:GNAT superfamily N-acetyltransferase